MRFDKETLREYRSLADQYKLATGKTTYRLMDVIDWGFARNKLSSQAVDVRRIHEAILAEALRTDVTKDEFGNKVRLRHCVEMVSEGEGGDVKQLTLWGDLDAPDPFLVESLLQRRRRIEADVNQLRADLEHINGHRASRGLPPIQMSFDFTFPDEGESQAEAL